MDNIWSGWRSSYVTDTNANKNIDCIMCHIFEDKAKPYIIENYEHVFVVMNAYPYTCGHIMVVPNEHHAKLTDLNIEASHELIEVTTKASAVLEKVFSPHGINVGANIGKAAGAGVPDHLHMHVLPRWNGDTNFTTAIANIRVLPEPLEDTYNKIKENWN